MKYFSKFGLFLVVAIIVSVFFAWSMWDGVGCISTEDFTCPVESVFSVGVKIFLILWMPLFYFLPKLIYITATPVLFIFVNVLIIYFVGLVLENSFVRIRK